METYFKLLLILSSLAILACESPDPAEIPAVNSDLSSIELSLVNIWKYDSIIGADTASYRVANGQLEVGINRNGLGGNRADLFRRRIRYFKNRTYQLQWTERGEYSLGTDGDANWQPNFGFWHMNGDTLIHNPEMFYETKYLIQIESDVLIRSSERIMSGCGPCSFQNGDTISFKEYFQRVD